MKWVVGVVIAVFVFFIVFRVLTGDESAPPPAPEPTQAEGTPAEPAVATPASALGAAAGTFVTQTPVPPTPMLTAAPRYQSLPTNFNSDKARELAAIAERVNCKLTAYQPTSDGCNATVSWATDNASQGGDFVELAVREGAAKDFDLHPRTGITMVDGRRTFNTTYHLRF